MEEELKNILERVRCLYLKYGIKSITMDDVARELGISKKTLYQYVADKTDLVAKILEIEIKRRAGDFNITNCREANAIEEMIMVNRHVINMLKEYNPATAYDLKKYYPDLYRKFYDSRHQKMYDWILNNLKRGKTENLYRNEIHEEIIAKLYVYRNEVIIENEQFDLNEYVSPKFFKEVLIYHIRGIATDKGIKVLNGHLEKIEEEV
jgi:TetR/AcrR family transcriptional regulator, cholesterol catabolism regulator